MIVIEEWHPVFQDDQYASDIPEDERVFADDYDDDNEDDEEDEDDYDF